MAPSEPGQPRANPRPPRGLLPGLAAALAAGAVAAVAARPVPQIGAPVIALLLGIGVRALVDRYRGPVTGHLRPGAAFAGRYLLQTAIVVFGAGLSVSTVVKVGAASLPVMLATLAVCLLAAWLLGRLLRVANPLRTLVGAGTGICGASAIAAVSPVVAADAAQVAYAVSTIVVYNIVATVVFPPIGHLLALGPHAFGLWAGTAVNDTSSVLATAYTYDAAAGQYAMVVKLTRSLMIVPVVVALVVWKARSGTRGEAEPGAPRTRLWRLVPPFIVAFLLAATANSTGLVPSGWHAALPLLAGYTTTVAMSGIGLGTSLTELRRAGLRPLAFGGLLSALTAGSSLALQALTGTLR